MRKLYRSREDRHFLGICGGLAQYWEIDPTWVRILFVVILIFSGFFPLLLCYLIAAMIIPLEPKDHPHHNSHRKLFRSRTDRKIAGVCGGIAKLLHIDSTVLRIIAVLICLFTGILPFFLIYLIAWAIIPEEG